MMPVTLNEIKSIITLADRKQKIKFQNRFYKLIPVPDAGGRANQR